MTIEQAVLARLVAKPDDALSSTEIGKSIGERMSSVSSALTKLVRNGKVDRLQAAPGVYIYQAKSGVVASPPSAPPIRRNRKKKSAGPVGILITVQFGKNESVTMSRADAEQVWQQLSGIFGR